VAFNSQQVDILAVTNSASNLVQDYFTAWDFRRSTFSAGAFAYVNFDGTTAANVTGTFTRTSNIVTVTVTGHGHIAGHRIYFVGAGIASDYYTVGTVIDANNFTFTNAGGNISSTSCTLNRRSIRKAVNVSNVVYGTSAGFYIVNMATSAPDTNYVFNATANAEGNYPLGLYACEMSNISANGGARGVNRFAVYTGDSNTDTGTNSTIINVAVFA
jgi:hypothetical protein